MTSRSEKRVPSSVALVPRVDGRHGTAGLDELDVACRLAAECLRIASTLELVATETIKPCVADVAYRREMKIWGCETVEELNNAFATAQAAIAPLADELAAALDEPVRVGGIVVTSAHVAVLELAKRMLTCAWFAADRKRCVASCRDRSIVFDPEVVQTAWDRVAERLLTLPSFDPSDLRALLLKETARAKWLRAAGSGDGRRPRLASEGTRARKGKPGAPITTDEVAKFALKRRNMRPQVLWKEIRTQWNTAHPDQRKTEGAIREAVRRYELRQKSST